MGGARFCPAVRPRGRRAVLPSAAASSRIGMSGDDDDAPMRPQPQPVPVRTSLLHVCDIRMPCVTRMTGCVRVASEADLSLGLLSRCAMPALWFAAATA